MATKPGISDAEWLVMKIIWEKSSTTAKEIIETLVPATGWKPKTVKTLINRLLTKKMIGFESKGRDYHYHPLANKKDYIEQETMELMIKNNPDSTINIISTLIRESALSLLEIDELKKELESKAPSKKESAKQPENGDFDIYL